MPCRYNRTLLSVSNILRAAGFKVLSGFKVERVLRVTFRLPEERIRAARDLLASTGIAVESVPLPEPGCRDPDDDRILALALAFEAEVLVTGDDDLLVLHPWSGISILRPRDFWPMDRAAAGLG